MAAFTISDMDLGPAQLYFTPAGSTAESYLGATLKNIKVAFSFDKAFIKADQTGTSDIDGRVCGVKCMVSTEIAQVKDFQLFNLIFPNSQLIGNAPFDGTSSTAAVQWNNTVGNSDLALAGKLRLHPQNLAATAVNYDWTFYKATSTENSEPVWGPTEQEAFKIEWRIYPDTTQTPFRWFRFGT
jgi:hypothetical protein